MFKFVRGDGGEWEYDFNVNLSEDEYKVISKKTYGSKDRWKEVRNRLNSISITLKGSRVVSLNNIPLEDSMKPYTLDGIPYSRKKYVIQRKDTEEFLGCTGDWESSLNKAKFYVSVETATNAWDQIRKQRYNYKPGFRTKKRKVGVYFEDEIEEQKVEE